MVNYVSKKQFSNTVWGKLNQIEKLTWSRVIPISERRSLPHNEGVLVLLDSEKDIIVAAIAATNKLPRRLGELLKDPRYAGATYFQYTFESNSYVRFSTRTEFKHLLKILETPIDVYANVLDDNDPRILEAAKVRDEIVKNAATTLSGSSVFQRGNLDS